MKNFIDAEKISESFDFRDVWPIQKHFPVGMEIKVCVSSNIAIFPVKLVSSSYVMCVIKCPGVPNVTIDHLIDGAWCFPPYTSSPTMFICVETTTGPCVACQFVEQSSCRTRLVRSTSSVVFIVPIDRTRTNKGLKTFTMNGWTKRICIALGGTKQKKTNRLSQHNHSQYRDSTTTKYTPHIHMYRAGCLLKNSIHPNNETITNTATPRWIQNRTECPRRQCTYRVPTPTIIKLTVFYEKKKIPKPTTPKYLPFATHYGNLLRHFRTLIS